MLNISSGKLSRPQKVVIYGPEGIGKTTFASRFPSPLFLDTEGGTAHLDVRRIDGVGSWQELLNAVNEVAHTPGVCGTLVLDTADWAEQIAVADVCRKYEKSSIEAFGYGSGYTFVADRFTELLAALNRVIASGANVVITAHTKMRKFEQPDELGSYDRWEMKLTKLVAPLIKEWADMVLFCNFETFVVSQKDAKGNTVGKSKAQGGRRVIYTSHHPCWDAKNRHGLPERIDMDFEAIRGVIPISGAKAPDPVPSPAPNPRHERLAKLLVEAEITVEQLQDIVAAKGHYSVTVDPSGYSDDFYDRWIFPNWEAIVRAVKNS